MRSGGVVVIGWDGACWPVLRRYVDAGELPTLAGMLARGVAADLKSTVPFHSGPAWASISTGVNPGKHNIFHFCRTRGYDLLMSNGSHRRSTPVWDHVGDAGMEVAVINIPMTYPPERVNGVMVSGMDTPSQRSSYAYPRELQGELERSGYRITWGSRNFRPGRELEFASELVEMERKRGELVTRLLQNPALGFLQVNFAASDRAQHFFWQTIGRGETDLVLKVYRELDTILARVLDSIDESATVLLLSDHGFGPFRKRIALGKWLRDEGLLRLKSRVPKYVIRQASAAIEKVGGGPALARLGRLMPPLERKLESAKISAWSPNWSKTRAWFPDTEGGIRINVRGREPSGIVEPGAPYEALRDLLIGKLEDLRDPADGSRVIEKAYRREEIYSGQYVGNAPDLIVHPAEGCALGRTGKRQIDHVGQGRAKTGDHTPTGVLVACGPDVRRGARMVGAAVYDIAATTLHVMGLPVPLDMDGRVLEELFDPDSGAARRAVERPSGTETEKSRIRARLRSLRNTRAVRR